MDRKFANNCLCLFVVFVLISLKLVTSAPAKFESESSVGQLFPYYVNVGPLDNPTYVYVAEEQRVYNCK